jgi:hypothetical protein
MRSGKRDGPGREAQDHTVNPTEYPPSDWNPEAGNLQRANLLKHLEAFGYLLRLFKGTEWREVLMLVVVALVMLGFMYGAAQIAIMVEQRAVWATVASIASLVVLGVNKRRQ